MGSMLRSALVSCVALVLAACSSTVPTYSDASGTSKSSTSKKSGASSSSGDDDDSAAPATSDASGTAATATVTTSAPAGLVVIDLQNTFFTTAQQGNPLINVSNIQANAIKLMQAAGAAQRPVFVTYEATKSGDHAYPTAIRNAETQQTTEFVKTTFGAMGLPAFHDAIINSGLKRMVIVGAETDVCVMQTTMGLRKAGIDVVAVSDALMTEEENTAPTLRRYAQMGVAMATTAEALNVLSSGAPTAAAATGAVPKFLSPLQTGIVLNDVEGLGASDPNASAKRARLHELLLLTEWFKLPLLAEDPNAAMSALPSDLRSLLTKPMVALANKPATVTNVAVAGGAQNLAQLVSTLGPATWVVSDAIIGTDAFEPLYLAGAVPSTYKGLYYELTVSVDQGGWPSQQWVIDGDNKYWNLTQAPEDLQPLTFSSTH